MGQPSLVIDDKKQFVAFLIEQAECRQKLTKVLIYDRSFLDDVIVGVDTGGTVQCVETTRGIVVSDFHQ